MNLLVFDGVVGSVSEGKNSVRVTINHRSNWRDAKDNTWKSDESWFTAVFFGAKKERAREIRPGQAIVIEGAISTYPKSGPDQKIRITVQSFHLVDRGSNPPAGAKAADFEGDSSDEDEKDIP